MINSQASLGMLCPRKKTHLFFKKKETKLNGHHCGFGTIRSLQQKRLGVGSYCRKLRVSSPPPQNLRKVFQLIHWLTNHRKNERETPLALTKASRVLYPRSNGLERLVVVMVFFNPSIPFFHFFSGYFIFGGVGFTIFFFFHPDE